MEADGGGEADDDGEADGGGSGFFLTQNEEADEIKSPRDEIMEIIVEKPQLERKTSGKSSSVPSTMPPFTKREIPQKFRGFEMFFDGADPEEDAEFPEFKHNIQANASKLKFALNRANTFVPVNRHRLEKVYPVKFKLKKEPLSSPSQLGITQIPEFAEKKDSTRAATTGRRKTETMLEALRNMKQSVPLQEAKLIQTINENKTKPKRQQKFPEAGQLLTRVQRQYNNVRVESLQDTLEAKDAIMSALRRMEKALGPTLETKSASNNVR
jgi:hypothetical protein